MQNRNQIATKEDLPNAMPIAQLEESFARVTKGYTVRIVKTTYTTPFQRGKALYDAFEWLVSEIQRVEGSAETKATPAPPLSTLPNPCSPDNLEKTLNAWVERADADTDLPYEIFMQQFTDVALPSWDHYTHVRLAYLVLFIHGRQKGKNSIFDGIERYIARSTQTRGHAFHFTMSYFWIQMPSQGPRRTSSTTTLTNEDPARTFPHFLLTNPFLARSLRTAFHLYANVATPDPRPPTPDLFLPTPTQAPSPALVLLGR
ncbi:hypothetical protein C8F01DRAFT_1251995 [Mycena amicta]|nr:hypothetical protein C8F01DRAFT_1251995 [Mycena amicta]